jgi:hypothetical protein
MKRIVAIVLFVVLVLNCAPTLPRIDYSRIKKEQPIIINDRVGDVIDAEEREQYGLFPSIAGFEEARFYPLKDGGYVLEVITEERTLVSVNSYPDAIMIIKEYVDDYEALERDSDAYVTKWSILDYDALGIPITADEVTLTISRNRSTATRSCVGCIGGSALFAFVTFAGIAASGGSSGTDIGPPLAAAVGLGIAGAVLVAGLIGGITIYKITYKKDPDSVIEQIKRAREPRPVE